MAEEIALKPQQLLRKRTEVVPPAKTADEIAAEEAASKPKWYEPKAEEIAAVQALREGVARDLGGGSCSHEGRYPQRGDVRLSRDQEVVSAYARSFRELSAAMEHELTLGSLRRAHADYDTVIGEVEKWVDTLPAAYKAGAKDVLEQGTPEEVAGLVSEYKHTKTPPAITACSEGTPDANLRGSEEGSEKLKR